jgi:hypothetical protein
VSARAASSFTSEDSCPLVELAEDLLAFDGIVWRDPVKVTSLSYNGLSFSFTCLVDGVEQVFAMPPELELPLLLEMWR